MRASAADGVRLFSTLTARTADASNAHSAIVTFVPVWLVFGFHLVERLELCAHVHVRPLRAIGSQKLSVRIVLFVTKCV